jgi:hypothetical protein
MVELNLHSPIFLHCVVLNEAQEQLYILHVIILRVQLAIDQYYFLSLCTNFFIFINLCTGIIKLLASKYAAAFL